MQTQSKIDRVGKELGVLQELPRKNRIRRQLSFIDFVANRGKLGFGRNSQRAKAVSEEIIGDFDNQEISDAVYCYMSSNSDAGEKQIVANELAVKIIAMSKLGDVILLAASIGSDEN
jgi:hypothetical protein